MNKQTYSLLYLLLDIYAAMVSYYFNHNVILAIVHFIFGPIYLIYSLLVGHFAHGQWQTIFNSYF
jgi:hypothetical protein